MSAEQHSLAEFKGVGTAISLNAYRAMIVDPLRRMRERIDQCRRLAALVHQADVKAQLLQMAADGEADLRRLKEERAAANPNND